MKVAISRLLAVFLFSPAVVLASVNYCTDTDEDHIVQCIYTTGLKENENADGRYIKVEYTHQNKLLSYVYCMNDTAVLKTYKKEAKKWLGSLDLNFSICSDKSGSHCQNIKNETINIVKENDEYIATPKLTEIPLSAYASQYPSCDPLHDFDNSLMRAERR